MLSCTFENGDVYNGVWAEKEISGVKVWHFKLNSPITEYEKIEEVCLSLYGEDVIVELEGIWGILGWYSAKKGEYSPALGNIWF